MAQSRGNADYIERYASIRCLPTIRPLLQMSGSLPVLSRTIQHYLRPKYLYNLIVDRLEHATNTSNPELGRGKSLVIVQEILMSQLPADTSLSTKEIYMFLQLMLRAIENEHFDDSDIKIRLLGEMQSTLITMCAALPRGDVLNIVKTVVRKSFRLVKSSQTLSSCSRCTFQAEHQLIAMTLLLCSVAGKNASRKSRRLVSFAWSQWDNIKSILENMSSCGGASVFTAMAVVHNWATDCDLKFLITSDFDLVVNIFAPHFDSVTKTLEIFTVSLLPCIINAAKSDIVPHAIKISTLLKSSLSSEKSIIVKRMAIMALFTLVVVSGSAFATSIPIILPALRSIEGGQLQGVGNGALVPLHRDSGDDAVTMDGIHKYVGCPATRSGETIPINSLIRCLVMEILRGVGPVKSLPYLKDIIDVDVPNFAAPIGQGVDLADHPLFVLSIFFEFSDDMIHIAYPPGTALNKLLSDTVPAFTALIKDSSTGANFDKRTLHLSLRLLGRLLSLTTTHLPIFNQLRLCLLCLSCKVKNGLMDAVSILLLTLHTLDKMTTSVEEATDDQSLQRADEREGDRHFRSRINLRTEKLMHDISNGNTPVSPTVKRRLSDLVCMGTTPCRSEEVDMAHLLKQDLALLNSLFNTMFGHGENHLGSQSPGECIGSQSTVLFLEIIHMREEFVEML